MTNAQIILVESIKLMEEGVLKSVGKGKTLDGRIIDLPEDIHTFQAWKSLGYAVKKGEKAIAKFPIWKHTSKKYTDEKTKEEKEKSSMFMKVASFFKLEQVEKIPQGQ